MLIECDSSHSVVEKNICYYNVKLDAPVSGFDDFGITIKLPTGKDAMHAGNCLDIFNPHNLKCFYSDATYFFVVINNYRFTLYVQEDGSIHVESVVMDKTILLHELNIHRTDGYSLMATRVRTACYSWELYDDAIADKISEAILYIVDAFRLESSKFDSIMEFICNLFYGSKDGYSYNSLELKVKSSKQLMHYYISKN